jgi:hypothetical protein
MSIEKQIYFVQGFVDYSKRVKDVAKEEMFSEIIESLKELQKIKGQTKKQIRIDKATSATLEENTETIQEKQPPKKAKHPEYINFLKIHRQICDSRRVAQNMNATQGAALNKIIDRLKEQANGDGQIASAAWQHIANNWDELKSGYIRENVDCTRINQNLTVIIQHFTNDTDSKNKSGAGNKRGGVTLNDLNAMFE